MNTALVELYICYEVLRRKLLDLENNPERKIKKVSGDGEILVTNDEEIDKTISRMEKVSVLLEQKVELYVDRSVSADGYIQRYVKGGREYTFGKKE